ncbi:putative sucrose-phosphate synthase 2 [Wolffia australiana]
MAANEWINGYLEAILDAGGPPVNAGDESVHQRGAASLVFLGESPRRAVPSEGAAAGLGTGTIHFNPTRYFVDEVVTGVDESDLHRAWIKVIATRHTRERSSRLENMCWRIWNLTRKIKQAGLENFQREASRRLEWEQGRKNVTEELSEDLEGEKDDVVPEILPSQTPIPKFHRNFSGLQLWSDDNKEKKLYIVLISLHGLVRGENMELGRDSDTGGQVKYVVELARALARMPGVYRVDLFTRQIAAPDVDWSYGEPTEMLTTADEDISENSTGDSAGAYIIRIPFGPRTRYLRKELLWPYVQEFVDGALAHVINMSKVLGDQIGDGQPIWPYVIHGHYADAGDSAALLSGALNVPMVVTGHSLGRNKMEQLLKQGRQSMDEINASYKILRRIEAEELSLDAAELVITSTNQEIEEQWGLYDGFDVKLEKILRARARRGVCCHGRYMPRMVVIWPGMDFGSVTNLEEITYTVGEAAEAPANPPIWSEVTRFLTNPHKPMILALSRPDPKKNITTLLKAYGECRALRDLANLTLIMGTREDIDDMSAGNAGVLTTVLKLVDKYDLYGQVSYPKHHKQSDVPEIYRLAASTKGVFINPALVEPFGLTLIEAAAHGLPVVATQNGGPVDIHGALNNGLLVDPHNQWSIAEALLKLLTDKPLWHECRRNGWDNVHLFSWPEHCRTYLTRAAACRMRHPQWQPDTPSADLAGDDSLNDSLGDDSFTDSLGDPVLEEDELQDQVNKILCRIRRSQPPPQPQPSLRRPDAAALRRRRRLVVAALDCYDGAGAPARAAALALEQVFRAVKMDPNWGRLSGLALSTAMPISETLGLLRSARILPSDFDVIVCSSGGELYYPGNFRWAEEEGNLCPDPDYAAHIEYRWDFDGVRGTLGDMINQGGDLPETVALVDAKSCRPHCVSFLVPDPSKARRVDFLRRKLRMRGIRCHLMYCRNSTRLQAIPLLASRSQALRQLFVRWGLNVSNMFVILGERGDTDHEEMIAGSHKTIILGDVVTRGSEELLRSPGSYQKEDIFPAESPLVISGTGGITADQILKALKDSSQAPSNR